MKTVDIIVTMNGETHSGRGKATFQNGAAEITYDFWGGSVLSFDYAKGSVSRKEEMEFSLPLGIKEPQKIYLKTAFGEVPTVIWTTRYCARVSETFAVLTAVYYLSDGFVDQEFSFSLTAQTVREEI